MSCSFNTYDYKVYNPEGRQASNAGKKFYSCNPNTFDLQIRR